MDNPDNIFWTIDIVLFAAIIIGLCYMFISAKDKDEESTTTLVEDAQNKDEGSE